MEESPYGLQTQTRLSPTIIVQKGNGKIQVFCMLTLIPKVLSKLGVGSLKSTIGAGHSLCQEQSM